MSAGVQAHKRKTGVDAMPGQRKALELDLGMLFDHWQVSFGPAKAGLPSNNDLFDAQLSQQRLKPPTGRRGMEI